MAKEKKLNNKPMVLVFAGPNGSGKSTITEYFETPNYTNADDIVKSMGVTNEEAAQIVQRKRYEAIAKKEDFSFETVLSSDYSMNILRKAKSEDYFLKCIFVLTIDPNINYARILSRVEMGGHDVIKEKIYKRYYRSLANISELINLCDILHVYDNSSDENGFSRIIRKHKDDITIFPNSIWSKDEIIKLIDNNNTIQN